MKMCRATCQFCMEAGRVYFHEDDVDNADDDDNMVL